MAIVPNIINMVRGFKERAEQAKIKEEAKNFLNSPELAIANINEINPFVAQEFQQNYRNQQTLAAQQQDTERKRRLEATGQATRFLRGLPEGTDYGAAIDSMSPYLKNSLGMGDADLATWKQMITANPSVINALDDDVNKARAEAQYGAKVLTPGSALNIGGKRVDSVPFARQMKVVPDGMGGNTVMEFDPNVAGGGTSAPSAEAVPASPAPAVGAVRGLPMMSGDQVEARAMSAVPGMTVTSRARDPQKNASVDGVANSWHLPSRGAVARDFVPPAGMTMGQLHGRLKQAFPGYDVINEGDHVHIEPGRGTARGGGGSAAAAAPGAPPPPQTASSARVLARNPGQRVRTLTPQEAQQAGYPAGAVVQVDGKGKQTVTYKPPATALKGNGKFSPEQIRERATDTLAQMQRLRQAALQLRDSPAFDQATGTIEGLIPSIRQGSVDFDNQLQSLRDRVVISTIQSMKAMSATGASGFGALTEKEGMRLENSQGSLNQRSPEVLKQSLNDIIKFADEKIRGLETGLKASQFPNAPAVGTVRGGYTYVGGDPAQKSSWRKQ